MANTTAITTKRKDFNNNTGLPDTTNKSGEELLAAMWGLTPTKTKQVSNISKVYYTKHGMFASIPILCRGVDCAYKDVCMVDPSERTVGSRCPMEIAALITRFNQWCQHFNINIEGEAIESKDLVDATLIKDLVNIEIQILRAENKIALSGDFMGETLVEVDKKCNAYYGTVITPESEFLMTLQDKKMKILNQLNATRKDKAADKRKETASDEAVRIFQQMQELQREQNKAKFDIMDVDFDENGDIIEKNYSEITENDASSTDESAENEGLTVENTENSQKIEDKEE
jgi:hypothetical protein